jgi:glycogen debranching enzyme
MSGMGSLEGQLPRGDSDARYLQALLTEFNKLRDEIQNRSTAQHTLVNLNLTAGGALAGASFLAKFPLLVLLLPLVSSALGLLYFDHHTAILHIGGYIRSQLYPRLRSSFPEQRLPTYEDAVEAERRDLLSRIFMTVPFLVAFLLPGMLGLVYTSTSLAHQWFAISVWVLGLLMTLTIVVVWFEFAGLNRRSPEQFLHGVLRASRWAMARRPGGPPPPLTVNDLIRLKHGDVFLLCQRDGDVNTDTDPELGQGLYFRDTRFLDRLILRVEGRRLRTESWHISGSNQSAACLIGSWLMIQRERVLQGPVRETIAVRNLAPFARTVKLHIELAASFESIFHVRGFRSAVAGRPYNPTWEGESLLFRYDGADKHIRSIAARFTPAPEQPREGSGAVWRFQLGPWGTATGELVLQLKEQAAQGQPQEPVKQAPTRGSRPAVGTSNETFNRVLARCLEDLELLSSGGLDTRYFAAGLPWYGGLFGRDSIISSLQSLAFSPEIAAGTLRVLALNQGKSADPAREEEPGKVLHELRVDELTNIGILPHSPSYGTVDATPLFVVLLAEYVRWTGDVNLWHELQDNVERALKWIDEFGDRDGDGFTDYGGRANGAALTNQGWKDSGNSITHSDGSLVEPPVALVEVQGYVYRAKRDAAWLYRLDGQRERANHLEAEADRLRARFRVAYWAPSHPYLAVAIARGRRRAESITSNPGQALWGSIVDADQAQWVARRLVSRSMFSGWGIRTMATTEVAYDPGDYQCGAIWPHDNSVIMAGLHSYGFLREAERVFTAMFEASQRFPMYRLPELFPGHPRRRFRPPGLYQQTCSPQAWAAGAIPYMLATSLGLLPDATSRQLVLDRPDLPRWLTSVEVRGLRVGDSTLDLAWKRRGGITSVRVLGGDGKVEVVVRRKRSRE